MIWTDLTLKSKGYDGLYCPNECACKIGDLRPCGQTISETLGCKPGYLSEPDDDEFRFTISSIKGGKAPNYYAQDDD